MEENYRTFTETVLGGDPKDRPWEGCINSVTYRVPRGVPVRLPRFLYDHIERTEREKKTAEDTAEMLSSIAMKL